MKKLLLLIGIMGALSFAMPKETHAVGLGIIVGEPTGISLAIGRFPVLGFSWSFYGNFLATIDGWIINDNLSGIVDWYFGIGGKVGLYQQAHPVWGESDAGIGLGVRFPIGLQIWALDNLEIFGELVPGMALYPLVGFDPGGGIGLRFHF